MTRIPRPALTNYPRFYSSSIRLADAKDAFDDEGRLFCNSVGWQRLKLWLRGYQRPTQGWSSIRPAQFVALVLPYTELSFCTSEMNEATVDPSLILRGTYNDYSDTRFHPRSAREVMDWSDALANKPTYSYLHSPRALQVGEFLFIVPQEGKNRTSLFKSSGRAMGVLVHSLPYPPANDLKLTRSWPWGVYRLSCKGVSHVLPLPGAVLPLLQEYGVSCERSQSCWPVDVARLWFKRREMCLMQMG